jgi:type IV secretion system protein TrbE
MARHAPGHPVPNVRRPPLHTDQLADLLPLSGVWTGREENPCPFYPAGSPPLLHAATTGATPFRANLHVGDVAHTLIFGPTGAGKSTLLCTVAMPELPMLSKPYRLADLARVIQEALAQP